MSDRRAIRLGILAAIQAMILPALGLPMFFRNEAAWHYLLWQRMPFFDLFRDFLTSRSSMSNAVASRPLVRMLEWAQVRLFGLDASAYVVVNGGLFVGFALALFALAWRLSGPGGAVLSVLLLMTCFQLVFYPVLNAIHGLQYPLEMALCTAAFLAFLNAFERRRHGLALGIVLAFLAFVSHAASAIAIPLALAAMAATATQLRPERRVWLTLLLPLGVGFAFVIERGGVPGGLAAQPTMAAKVQFAMAQFAVLGALITKIPTGPALAWALAYEALALLARLRQRPTAHAVAALALAMPLWLAWRSQPVAAIVMIGVLILIAVWQRPRHAFLAVWAAAGVVLFLATPESNASYTRHFAVPCILLMADAYRRMLLEHPAVQRALARRPSRLEWGAAAATLGLVGITALATRVPVPALSSKLEQVRYVRDLSLNFRAALTAALEQVPPHGTLAFVAGRSRSEEMQSLYGEDYFARLQPAKADHYGDFVALMGRADVTVRMISSDSLVAPAAGGAQTPLLAVNAWEVGRAESAGLPTAGLGLVQRGRARAGVFGVAAP